MGREVQVFAIQWVAAWACRLLALPMPTTREILPARDRLKVGRIDAGAVSTKVVEFKAGWYRADPVLIGDSMRWLNVPRLIRPGSSQCELPVAAARLRRGPDPASRVGIGEFDDEPM